MAKILTALTKIDERGTLTIIDGILPFEIKRIFYIYNVVSQRGGHRHVHNKMALIALNGSIDISVQTPSDNLHFKLNSDDQILLLDPEDWHTMNNFTKGSTLLVLNSHSWDKDDYVYEPYRT